MKPLHIIQVGVWSALTLLLMAGDGLADGPIVRMQAPDSREARLQAGAASGAKAAGDAQAVVFSGQIRHRPRQGLSVGGVPILLGANTGIFPDAGDRRMLHPSSLQGMHATVMGVWPGHGPVEAQLILLRESTLGAGPPAELRTGMIPSASDPEVGEMTDEVAR